MASESGVIQGGARQKEIFYCNLDSTLPNTHLYEDINTASDEGTATMKRGDDPQYANTAYQKKTNDTKDKDMLFAVKRRTLIIGVSALVFVVVAQIATCCYVGLYIGKRQTDSTADKLQGGNSLVNPLSNTSQTAPSHWSSWTSWTSCTVTCDIGLQRRNRSCLNRSPDPKQETCYGDTGEYRICSSNPCTDGGWSTWQLWSSCSASCGNGFKTRTRDCSNPAPSAYGKPCLGQVIDIDSCNNMLCSNITSSFTATVPKSIVNRFLTFSNIIHNQGSDYDADSGVFNCSKPGVYFFSFTLVKKRASTRVDLVYCYLNKNNINIMIGKVDPTDDDTDNGSAYAGNTAVIHLDKGDLVGLFACSNPPSTYMESWTSFSGFLLHPDV